MSHAKIGHIRTNWQMACGFTRQKASKKTDRIIRAEAHQKRVEGRKDLPWHDKDPSFRVNAQGESRGAHPREGEGASAADRERPPAGSSSRRSTRTDVVRIEDPSPR